MRHEHLSPMRRLADPPPSVNPDTYVPLSRRRRLAGRTPIRTRRSRSFGQAWSANDAAASPAASTPARGRSEGHEEEGVTLGVDLVPTVRS